VFEVTVALRVRGLPAAMVEAEACSSVLVAEALPPVTVTVAKPDSTPPQVRA